MSSHIVGLLTLSLAFAPAYAAAAKQRVAIYVDGERTDQLFGALYASLVNAVDLVPSEDAQSAMAGARALPPDGKPLDELTWKEGALDPARAVATTLGADVLVLVRTLRRSDKHVTVSVLSLAPGEKPRTELYTIKGSGKGVDQSFNFKPVVQGVTQLVLRRAEGS